MHILVTNDDGVYAPGLLALVEAVRPLGKVTVLAPDRNWSASGHVKTLERPLRVREVELADGSLALASDGAPSDCVALAMLGLVPEPIDLVVSGVNPHANLGHDLTYSGTVTAALEGTIFNKPSIAFSLDTPEGLAHPVDYTTASHVARTVAQRTIESGLPHGVALNVNVPYRAVEDLQGYQITRLGLRVYRDELLRRSDPRGKPYYWIGGELPTGVPAEGTDISALEAGFVSITPVQLDLTAAAAIDELQRWDWDHRINS